MIFYALQLEPLDNEAPPLLSQCDVWGDQYPDTCPALFASHAEALSAINELYRCYLAYEPVSIIQLNITDLGDCSYGS